MGPVPQATTVLKDHLSRILALPALFSTLLSTLGYKIVSPVLLVNTVLRRACHPRH